MQVGRISDGQLPRGWWLTVLAVAALAGCAAHEGPSKPPAVQSASAAPASVDQLSFLLGRWVGTQSDGRPMVLEFFRRGPDIIVSSGGPLYVITLSGPRVVAQSAVGNIDAHLGWLATWDVAQFGPNLVGFNGITAFRWKRIGEDVLEHTEFEREDGGFRPKTILLRRDALWEPPPEERPTAARVRPVPAPPRVPYGAYDLLGPPEALSPDEAWIREHVREPWGVAVRWVSPDRLATMIVTDDGRMLRVSYLTRRADGGICIGGGSHLQYQGAGIDLLSTERLQGLVRGPSPCLSVEQNAAQARAWDRAQPDLDAALTALRARAEALYGTLERCRYGADNSFHPALRDPNCLG